MCRAVLCRARNPLPPLSKVPARPDEPPPTHPTSKTDPISSGEVAWARHQDSVTTCLQSHMSPPIGLSQRDGVGWGGAMRQRKLGSHTPPCHRRMVITTLFSASLAALQHRLILYHTRWLLTVHRHWSSGHLGQLAPTTHPQCRLVSNPCPWWGGGGGGARTIIEGVASTGWVSDARVETTTHFYTSRVW